MNKFSDMNSNKLGKERLKREHDLLMLNRVTDREFESRMAIWDAISLASAPLGEAKQFVEATFNKLQKDISAASKEFTLSFADFEVMANEEMNYIRMNVADTRSQKIWYGLISVMVLGTIYICMA
ncbi:hypothetical protein JCM19239_3765 [Vibrio variabilis]|uniref:Thiamine-phosphate diphosphorylase n=1 Tax=Vibrio variabilis TaxID=990271 RepID=A0ABQ0J9S6_9VIBR|nr:hypothetical protein JCM19239_3765 [Vibrio variabilis]